jgi:hypothetical protein
MTTDKPAPRKRMGRPLKGDKPRSARIGATVPQDVRDTLEEVAAAEGCTMSDALIRIVREWRAAQPGGAS